MTTTRGEGEEEGEGRGEGRVTEMRHEPMARLISRQLFSRGADIGRRGYETQQQQQQQLEQEQEQRESGGWVPGAGVLSQKGGGGVTASCLGPPSGSFSGAEKRLSEGTRVFAVGRRLQDGGTTGWRRLIGEGERNQKRRQSRDSVGPDLVLVLVLVLR